jgi:hypothetical protein
MTAKQTALSRLARLALNTVSESPPRDRAEVCQLVAVALHDECPDLANLARQTATQFHQASDAESDLLTALTQ